MPTATSRSAARQKRHSRLRLRVAGSAERPRLAVFRSTNQIYAQVIDDTTLGVAHRCVLRMAIGDVDIIRHKVANRLESRRATQKHLSHMRNIK